MKGALLVCSSENSIKTLTDLLRGAGYSDVCVKTSGGEARRTLCDSEYALVVINAPLGDEFGHELAQKASETLAGVLLLVKNEFADEVAGKVESDGVLVLSKPLGRALFFQSLRLVEAAQRRMLGLRKENMQLQKKVEEIRLVNRAKCVLIQVLSMTEPQAHRYIEKQAMDMRQPKRAIAEGILKTYET